MNANVAPVLAVVLSLLSIVVLVPASVFAIEIVAAALQRTPRRDRAREPAPASTPDRGPTTVAVLMPAHDEAEGIARTLRALVPQLGERDRMLVVADNCSDQTAAIARSEGAEVIERVDSARRGKGYALDAGVRHLERNPPDIVVIVDADCIVGPGTLDELARACVRTQRPVQALYLMHAPPGSPLRQRLAEFAWLVRNFVRPLGAAAVGGPCQLMGTGMAFPWPLLRDAPLATGHIVEDMQLGLDLAAAGAAPRFVPQALVTSEFPRDAGGIATQRTRWEHGHLSVIAHRAPRLLGRALASANGELAMLVLDLVVPPLASLVLAILAVLLVEALALLAGVSAVPLLVAALALALVVGGALLAWARFGRAVVRGRELLALPLYVVAKLPLYARLFTRRQSEWVRTRRDERSR